MSEGNGLSLQNRVVLMSSRDDQASSAGHANEQLSTLPKIPETGGRSAQQEPTLVEALGHMTRALNTLERNCQMNYTRLDAVLATIVTPRV